MTIFLLLFLILYGVWEYRSHRTRLLTIPIRIHVNGTRGKSSVTRLVAAGLRAGGRRVIAKTTGTKPRILLEDGREVPIFRIARPNIIEQLLVVRTAWQRRADILVLECMAVQPHLQWVSESKMIQSTVGVITNARADHLDQMGPTVADVAQALSNTIPSSGVVFTAEREQLPILEANAALRGAQVIAVESQVDETEMAGFSYIEHPENVALALAVCGHLGVPRSAALAAFYAATPDPGVLRAYTIEFPEKRLVFYNAFAANDRDSTLLICRRLGLGGDAEEPLFVIINNRGDRLQRAEQFGEMMARDLPAEHFFLVGDFTNATEEIALRQGLAPDRVSNLGSCEAGELFEAVLAKTHSRARVLAVGNIGGQGEEIVDYFANRGRETAPRRAAARGSAG